MAVVDTGVCSGSEVDVHASVRVTFECDHLWCDTTREIHITRDLLNRIRVDPAHLEIQVAPEASGVTAGMCLSGKVVFYSRKVRRCCACLLGQDEEEGYEVRTVYFDTVHFDNQSGGRGSRSLEDYFCEEMARRDEPLDKTRLHHVECKVHPPRGPYTTTVQPHHTLAEALAATVAADFRPLEELRFLTQESNTVWPQSPALRVVGHGTKIGDMEAEEGGVHVSVYHADFCHSAFSPTMADRKAKRAMWFA